MKTEYFIQNPENVDLSDPDETYHTEVIEAEIINGVLTVTLKILPID